MFGSWWFVRLCGLFCVFFNIRLVVLWNQCGESQETKKTQVNKHSWLLLVPVFFFSKSMQASSSLDPSFWPTHPTMERLWMYTMLTGKVEDMTWNDSDVTITASDGTTYTESVSAYSDSCVGHRGSDVFPFGLLKNDVAEFKVRTGIKGNTVSGNVLTNREVLAAVDPRKNMLPYIYDTFKWDHCAEDGYNLDDAWATPESPASSADVDSAADDKMLGKPSVHTANSKTSGPSKMGGAHRASAGGRPIFKKGGPRYPMYEHLMKMDRQEGTVE